MRLETQLILLLAVTTAATAAAAASELLHRSNSAIISDRQLTDIDHGDSHDLQKRSPAKFKGLGFFEGFAVAKKGFAKAGKGLGGFGLGKKGGKGATALFT